MANTENIYFIPTDAEILAIKDGTAVVRYSNSMYGWISLPGKKEEFIPLDEDNDESDDSYKAYTEDLYFLPEGAKIVSIKGRIVIVKYPNNMYGRICLEEE